MSRSSADKIVGDNDMLRSIEMFGEKMKSDISRYLRIYNRETIACLTPRARTLSGVDSTLVNHDRSITMGITMGPTFADLIH